MLTNNIPNTMPALEKLVRRTASADKSQQKEIRLTIQEAREVVQELAILTANLSSTVNDIHKILQDIKDSTTNIDVKFDGGGF